MVSHPQAVPPRFRLLPLAALIGGNIALALGPWFVRVADSGAVSAGFWRLVLAFPFVLLLARVSGESLRGVRRGMVIAVLVAGTLFGLDVASWHVGIGLTRFANSVLFGNAGSLILMGWGLFAMRRMPRGRDAAAVAAALIGSAVLLGRSLEISTETLAGDLFCVLAGAFYAGYLLILHDARRSLGGWSLIALSSLAAAPVLLGIALLRGEPVWPGHWGPLVGLAFCGQILGQGLLIYALRHFSPLVIGIALLTQPAVGAVAGWFAFGEVLAPLDLLGIALVGGALAMARSEPSTDGGGADSENA